MTKERAAGSQIFSDFVVRGWFGIRHSTFVIYRSYFASQ